MTFALSSKSYNCWQCDHFEPKDPEQSVEGWCRKYAPRGLDLYGPTAGGDILENKGDVLSHDGSHDSILNVGSDGQVLTVNSASTNGIEWQTPTPTSSPLTTKGDVYTHDAADDARLGVGADGQILSADSVETTGLKWVDAPTSSSPLTTKGDLYTHDAADDARLGVGSDGQILSADSVETNGLKWIDAPAGGDISYYHAEQLTPISTQATSYQTGLDLVLPPGFPGGTWLIMASYKWNYSQENAEFFIGHVVDTTDSEEIAVTWAQTVDMNNWEMSSGHDIRVLPAGSRTFRFEYYSSSASFTASANLIRISLIQLAPIAAEMASAKILEEEESAFVGSTNPDDITQDESYAKWCLVKVAPNEWCGEYKPASSRVVPPVPPFEYPEP